jgi:hypothetical protein
MRRLNDAVSIGPKAIAAKLVGHEEQHIRPTGPLRRFLLSPNHPGVKQQNQHTATTKHLFHGESPDRSATIDTPRFSPKHRGESSIGRNSLQDRQARLSLHLLGLRLGLVVSMGLLPGGFWPLRAGLVVELLLHASLDSRSVGLDLLGIDANIEIDLVALDIAAGTRQGEPTPIEPDPDHAQQQEQQPPKR